MQGCGVTIIKPLERAQKDNDSIRAIIAGSGINQDGKTPGITMPCGDAQGRFTPTLRNIDLANMESQNR